MLFIMYTGIKKKNYKCYYSCFDLLFISFDILVAKHVLANHQDKTTNSKGEKSIQRNDREYLALYLA